MKWTFALVFVLVSAAAFGQSAPASNIDQMLQPNAGPSAAQGVIGVVLAANGVDTKLAPQTPTNPTTNPTKTTKNNSMTR
jgi:hypothetical protein